MNAPQLRWSEKLHRVLSSWGGTWVSLADPRLNLPVVSADVARAAVPLIPATVWREGDPPPTHRVVLLHGDGSVTVWEPAIWTVTAWDSFLRVNGPVVQISGYRDAVADDEARRSR